MLSIAAVMDLLDFDGPDEEAQVLARLELMRRQPSFVPRYLEIIDEMRSVIVDFVAQRTGLDPRVDMYPLLVGGACTASWDTSLKLWAEPGNERSLRELRMAAYERLTAGLKEYRPAG